MPLRDLGGVYIRVDDVGAFAVRYAMMVPWGGETALGEGVVTSFGMGEGSAFLVLVGDAASPSSS